MLKSGDVVLQDYTMLNNKNYKDNKENRSSVVLFEVQVDGLCCACTCPITNSYRNAIRNPQDYYYPGNLLLGNTKLCCVKLNSIHMYNVDIIHPTGLSLDDCHMERIFDKIDSFSEDQDHLPFYDFVKKNINEVRKEKRQAKKKAKKEAKKQMKMMIRMAKSHSHFHQ